MNGLWLIPALLCYLAASIIFVLERTAGLARGRLATTIMGVGVVLQTAALATSSVRAGNIPVTNFAESIGFLAWLTAIACLLNSDVDHAVRCVLQLSVDRIAVDPPNRAYYQS
jgi:ABC-type transport system involved in cytochrome c biogenesis permease subunit